MKPSSHGHLRRLDRVWIDSAVYFVTVCSYRRRPALARPDVAGILIDEWRAARGRHQWLIGRYVIMPDHVHFFCMESAGGAREPLARFVGRWKEWTAKRAIRSLAMPSPFWQREFFDHVLRQAESYAKEWDYVRANPERADLVRASEEWPYQGWIDFDSPLDGAPTSGRPTL